MLLAVLHSPAIWGFLGAVFYASARLISATFTEPPPTRTAQGKAWAEFMLALFFGPVAAQGFGPTIADMFADKARAEAAWLTIGLAANGVWPIADKLLVNGAKGWLARKLKAVGTALDGDAK